MNESERYRIEVIGIGEDATYGLFDGLVLIAELYDKEEAEGFAEIRNNYEKLCDMEESLRVENAFIKSLIRNSSYRKTAENCGIKFEEPKEADGE